MDFDFDTALGAGRSDLDRQWRAILAGRGLETGRRGAVAVDILRALGEAGAATETTVAAAWRVERTVGEVLAAYAGRVYSSTWALPDPAYGAAVEELAAWARRAYASDDAAVPFEARFEVTAVRGWAGG